MAISWSISGGRLLSSPVGSSSGRSCWSVSQLFIEQACARPAARATAPQRAQPDKRCRLRKLIAHRGQHMHACRGINPAATTHIFHACTLSTCVGHATQMHAIKWQDATDERTSSMRLPAQHSTTTHMGMPPRQNQPARLHDACCTRCLSCADGRRTLINGRRKLTKERSQSTPRTSESAVVATTSSRAWKQKSCV